jgi:hypothetical protein
MSSARVQDWCGVSASPNELHDPCQGRTGCPNTVEVYVEWTEIAASWPDRPVDYVGFMCNDCCATLRAGTGLDCANDGLWCTPDHVVTVTRYRDIRSHRRAVAAASAARVAS